jgi:beta-galactosidase
MTRLLAEDEFLLSGEFHYFRVPRDAWRDRLRTMADAGLRAASIYVPWNWHAPSPDLPPDFTGSDVPERDLPAVLAEIADAGLSCIFRPGPFITAEWHNGGIPDWLLTGDVLALDADGGPAGAGRAYPVLTASHPRYQARARAWLEEALSTAARSGPIANVQLDDEPSYWRTLLEPLAADYNPYLIGHEQGVSRYARWLLDRYGGLGRLNHAYRTSYARPEQLEPPRERATSQELALRHLDWLEFKLAETNEYVEFLYQTVKGADVPVSLLHPYLLPWSAVRCGDFIRERQLPIQLTNECYLALFTGSAVTEAKLGAVLACHETYQMWGRESGPPVTIELQGSNASFLSAGSMELLYALTVARGIRGVNYYMTVGGTNPPGFEHITGAEYDLAAPIGKDGTTRPHYATIAKISSIMGGELGRKLADAEPHRDVWIGCYAPYEMAAISGGAAALGTEGIAETFDGGDIGMSAAESLTALMALNSVSFGCLDLETQDVSKTPQLWVPGGGFMAAGVQRKLADYVSGGGHLVLLPGIPVLDETLRPCTTLTDLIGGANSSTQKSDAFVIYGKGGTILAATGTLTTLDPPPDARILATDAKTGRVCAFTRDAGLGKVTYLGFGLRYLPTAGPGQHDFLLALAPRAVWADTMPFAAFLLRGPRASLLCVANPLDQPGQTVAHYPGGEVTVRLDGRGAVLLPVDVQVSDDITVHSATWELVHTAPVDDEPVNGGTNGTKVAITFATRGERRGVASVTSGIYEIKNDAGDAYVTIVAGG